MSAHYPLAPPQRSFEIINGRCHPERTWARGPRLEMKVIAAVTPAKAGVDLGKIDSRFCGNDVTFDGTKQGISLWFGRIGPDKQGEIPRFARNDRRR